MTTEIAAAASTLTPEQAELQARARAFVEEVLIPLEVEAERARRAPARPSGSPRSAARRSTARLAGGLHAVEHGGQGWSARRVVPRRGAVRALHQRALVARAERLQRARPTARPAQIERYLQARRCAASCTTPTR